MLLKLYHTFYYLLKNILFYSKNIGIVVFLFLFCISTLFLPSISSAENYNANVSRRGSNLYEVTGSNILIKTRLCLNLAIYSDAIITTEPYGGEIIFLDDKDRCDIESFFGPANYQTGTYKIYISHSGDNFFEVQGTNLLIKTLPCYYYVYGIDAILKVNNPSSAQLLIPSYNANCFVEKIYTKIRP